MSSIGFSISNQWVKSTSIFNNKKSVIVWVESFLDIRAWKDSLDQIIDADQIKLDIKHPGKPNESGDNLALGCNGLLKAIREKSIVLGDSQIACLDSDYHYILDHYSGNFIELQKNSFIFQTKVHSIENIYSIPNGLLEICQRANCSSHSPDNFNFLKFFEEWSKHLFPAHTRVLFLYKNQINDEAQKFNDKLTQVVAKIKDATSQSILDYSYLSIFQEECITIAKEIDSLIIGLTPNIKYDKFIKDLSQRGMDPETSYLFYRGHDFFDNVTQKTIKCVSEFILKHEMKALDCSENKQLLNNEKIDPIKLVRARTDLNKCHVFCTTLQEIGQLFSSRTQ